ncbi:AAA family ATPase [Pseudomonas denitrificans (nom. rej.)]|uniref:AAA family ATPase n=1 Tax=Pseudomonas denitrificans TaxID=43306 RepID=A0A9X7N4U1_PSEDE|nr:AAA family ATPase [Pseudomonas denitrificans (nom. rej.)]QEY75059.1 AAA family ATPase [Pseudomonas denitrificans (nom. rej.)]
MSTLLGVLQVSSVKPGSFGGAVFSGRIIGDQNVYTCKASYKIITRPPQPGECWHIKGTIIGHDQFRSYVQIEDCHIVNVVVAAYIEKLLIKHPAFRGLSFGKAKVGKLVREFGAENLAKTLSAGKSAHIAEVVNPDLAEKLVESWLTLHNEIATVEFLMQHKFEPSLARSILKVCSTNTVERLKQNPYSLIAFQGTHANLWRTIEAAAGKLGIERDDPRRLAGLVEHILYGRLDQGHTACPVEDLEASLDLMLKSKALASQAIQCALDRRAVCVKKLHEKTLIQPLGAAIIESQLELRVRELASSQRSLLNGCVSEIDEAVEKFSAKYSEATGHTLADQQKLAITMALTNRISTLTGFGGTGKTTVLRAIVDIASACRTVYVLALSGKAKERAKEAIGRETYTIHNFIAQAKDKESTISTGGDPLIIVDEASMVDIALMLKLLRVFGKNSFSLLLVGDTGQLSPVGFGIFFHTLARSKLIPCTHLTKVHRTAADSPLQQTAMQVRTGHMESLPVWSGETDGVYLVHCSSSTELLNQLTKIKAALPEAQILTPHMSDRMPDSGYTINNHLQAELQGSDQNPGIWMGKFWLRVDDPVIITQNSYEHCLFNGNTGVMTGVTVIDGQPFGTFSFNGATINLSRADLFVLGMRLAYAISIHKSQGSEYQTSIICSLTNSDFVERSMFYTGISRSKRLTLIMSTFELTRQSIARQNRSDTLCVGFSV